jgi:hypothetical protein
MFHCVLDRIVCFAFDLHGANTRLDVVLERAGVLLALELPVELLKVLERQLAVLVALLDLVEESARLKAGYVHADQLERLAKLVQVDVAVAVYVSL